MNQVLLFDRRRVRERAVALLLTSALGACACARKRAEPGPAVTAAPSAPSASAPSTTAATPRAPTAASQRTVPLASASAGAKIELSPQERQAEQRYLKAIERGRRATLKKDFDGAEAAFSEALKARKGDSRAFGERGYARLLAGRLDAASDDFYRADGRTSDRTLAAQIFFNQGLVAERRGDLEGAKVAFARSQKTHSTAAAAKKVSQLGKSTCTAAVMTLSQPMQHYASWRAFYKTLDRSETVATDDDVRKALGVETCTDACVAGDWEWHVVVPASSGLDVVPSVDSGGYYRCGAPPQFNTQRRGSVLWVTSTNTELQTGLCGNPCTEDSCMMCCEDGPSHQYDTFIDLSSRRVVLRISQYAAMSDKFAALPVKLEGNTVRISGEGCDRSVMLTGR